MKIRNLLLAIIFILGMTACASHKEHDHDEVHEHDAHITLFAYSSNYEFFIVANPLVAGHEGKLMVHVTHLSTFKPMEKGSVRIHVSGNGNDYETQTDKCEEPGIYSFSYTPKNPGTVTLVVTVDSQGVTNSATFSGLTVFADEHEAHESAEAAEVKHPNGIAFSKEKSWVVDFATGIAGVDAMNLGIDAMAYVEPTAAGARTLCATTRGKVRILNPHLSVGENISAGATLFRVDASGIAEGDLRLQINQVQTEYNRAKNEYERLKKLFEEKLTTAAELSRAKADYELAASQLSALRQNFSGGNQSVTSPIAGFVQSIDVTDGQWVEAGQPLATIATSKTVKLTAKIPARYADKVSQISNALIFPTSGAEPVSLKAIGGHIVSDKGLIRPGEAMITVSMEMPNTLDLIPGSYVQTILQLPATGNSLIIPRGAVVEELGTTFVMVQLTPEYFEKREVKLGNTNGAGYEIISGLKEGERIVTRGASIIKLSQAGGALDPHAGHAH